MSIPTRLAAFAVATALALGGGYALGAAVGPLDQADPAPHDPPRDAPAHSTPTTAPHTHAGMSR